MIWLQLDGGLLDGGEVGDVQFIVVGWVGEAANVILMGSNLIFNGDESLQESLALGWRNFLAKFPPTEG